jgi:predicted aspartyl protease
MGLFGVKVKLASLTAPERTEELSLLVDTGATLSWIPRELRERLGVGPLSRLPFTLADSRELTRDTSGVLMVIDGRKAMVPVAIGEPGQEAVLGATALEILGFTADPAAQKLVPPNLFALLQRFITAPDACGWAAGARR